MPGVHSNVGGGYPDDSVAHIPLVWILSEARACGLRFKSSLEANPQTFDHPATAQDKDGRIYDPRAGLGGYYRYGPRDILALGKHLLSRQGAEPLPRIHESVLNRIKNRAHAYAPIGVPARYEVVTADGEVLKPEHNSCESLDQATARSHAQEKVWNTVWARRIVYFLTVGVSIYLFAFPLMRAAPADDEFVSRLRWVSDIVRTAGAFLPPAANPWINGYARDPGQFVVVALALTAVLLWGSRLAGWIGSGMDGLWRGSLEGRLIDPGAPTDPIYRLRTSAPYIAIHQALKQTIAPALFAIMFVYLGLAFTSHALFNVQDVAGLVCRESKEKLQGLNFGEIVLANGQTAKLSDFTLRARTESGPVRQGQEKPVQIRAGTAGIPHLGAVPEHEGHARAQRQVPDPLRKHQVVPRRQYPGCRGVLFHGPRGRVAKGPDGRRRSAAPGIDPPLVSGGGAHGRNRRGGKLPGPGSHRRIPDQ